MNSELQLSQPQSNPDFKIHPAQLIGEARAKHIVDALLEYNSGIIKSNPTGASAKFEKLTLSPFIFLRGTADLMYQDLVGTDADMAMVLCMGDVHLENYGVMETNAGYLIWGLNDFDEAAFAPFSWDVKRGATSTILAAQERDFSNKQCIKLARAFATAYLKGIQHDADHPAAQTGFTKKNAPKLIEKLIKKAEKIDSRVWLEENYLDPTADSPQFKKTDEIQPLSKAGAASKVAEFQAAVTDYLATINGLHKTGPTKIKVLDMATKTGSGTGSIGLWRYYALVEATRNNNTEMIILEIKQERPSVLRPYVGDGPMLFSSEGARVAFAEEIHLPDANPYYGYTTFDNISYLVRKRSQHKKRVKLEKLTQFKDFRQYTEACGDALAHSHLRSNWIVSAKGQSATQRMLRPINSGTFVADIAHFAEKMAEQATQDWKSFKQAFKAGKFTFK